MDAQSFPLLDDLLAAGSVWPGRAGGMATEGDAPASPPRFGSSPIGPPQWGLAELGGHVVELVGARASALTTVATMLAREAQTMGEPVAWLIRGGWTFYPPDLAAGGIDLAALAVVMLPDAPAVWRAVDRLVRSGAFGLVIVDGGGAGEQVGGALGSRRSERAIPLGVQARLVGLAKRYGTTILWLARGEGGGGKGAAPMVAASTHELGSFAAVRAQCERRRVDDGVFECVVSVLKDKRQGSTGPGARFGFRCDGTLGLR